MVSLTLNTSITSTHLDNFYSTIYNSGGYDWADIPKLYGCWFADSVDEPTPCEQMNFDFRIANTDIWLTIPGCGLCNSVGYEACGWNAPGSVLPYYFNFSNSEDPMNYYFFDRIRVNFGGRTTESNLNYTTVAVHVTDVSGANINDMPVTISYRRDCCYIMNQANISGQTDMNGNVLLTIFNPPILPWYASTPREYIVSAGNVSVFENIINIDRYPTSGYVELRFSCNDIQGNMNIS